MNVYLIGLIILLLANFLLIVVKGKRLLNIYLFLPFFTIAFAAFYLDLYNTYCNISGKGLLMIYINLFYIILLFLFMLLMDKKWKKPKLEDLNTEKLAKIVKILTVINLFITVFFLITLSKASNTSVIDLYLKRPYFLELNFESNAILGNLLKTNLFNLVLMVGLRIRGVYFKNYKLFIILSILILLAPNRKGELVLAILACTHLVFLYKKMNLYKLVKILTIVIGGIVLVFVITYSFYKTAGVDISIFNKIYTYLTFPIAGSSFLQKENIESIYHLKTFAPFFNKLNILEAKNIAIYDNKNFINGIDIGNVGGIFSPYYSDFGFFGPLIFIFIIVIFINVLELYTKNNIIESLFVIIIAFLDLALFGNYFTNNIFLEMCFSFALIYGLYKIRIPTITIKWKRL